MGFRTEIKNWKKIKLETAKLFLEQSNKRIEESSKTLSENSNTSFKLLILTSTLVSSLLVYLFTGSICEIICSFTHRSAAILLMPLIFCIIQLSRNLFRKHVYVPGFQPKDIMKDGLTNDNYKNDEQSVALILTLCENIQDRIDSNKLINHKIIKRVSYCILIIIISLIASPTLSLLVELLVL